MSRLQASTVVLERRAHRILYTIQGTRRKTHDVILFTNTVHDPAYMVKTFGHTPHSMCPLDQSYGIRIHALVGQLLVRNFNRATITEIQFTPAEGAWLSWRARSGSACLESGISIWLLGGLIEYRLRKTHRRLSVEGPAAPAWRGPPRFFETGGCTSTGNRLLVILESFGYGYRLLVVFSS